MPDRLAGRVALVTGAGRGLGRAHALALARLGATVVVNDPGAAVDGSGARDRAAAGAVVAEIGRAGGSAVADTTPVGAWEAATAIVDRTLERLGRLDVVVANAGIRRPGTLVGMTPEQWTDVLHVHLDGTATLAHAAARHWRERAETGDPRPARLITTTSPAGLFGGAGQAGYAAATAGIVALTRAAATELAPYGATANAVAPIARTRMNRDLTGPRHDPEHAARLVGWLATDTAAAVTGEVFLVGGGHVAVVARPCTGPTTTLPDGPGVDDLDALVPGLLRRADPHPDPLGFRPGRPHPPGLADLARRRRSPAPSSPP